MVLYKSIACVMGLGVASRPLSPRPAHRGVPRRVNALAHHTLIATTLTKAKMASVDHVQAALSEVT